MKKTIAVLFICAVIGTVHVALVYADFDYSIFDELSKEELEDIRDEINSRIDGFQSDTVATIADKDMIEFDDADVFLSSVYNRKEILTAIKECRCSELKASLERYKETHNQEPDIDEIISILDSYGDYYGIMSDVDYFTNNETVYYDGYRDIDETHVFRLYYFSGDYIEFGTMRDSYFFTTSAELKIIGQGNSWDGIKIGNKYGFSDQITEDRKYIEKEHAHLYDKDIDYLLNDMSGQVVIRFNGKKGTFDYECNDEDKNALQNMAKYFKVKNSINDILWKTQVID